MLLRNRSAPWVCRPVDTKVKGCDRSINMLNSRRMEGQECNVSLFSLPRTVAFLCLNPVASQYLFPSLCVRARVQDQGRLTPSLHQKRLQCVRGATREPFHTKRVSERRLLARRLDRFTRGLHDRVTTLVVSLVFKENSSET